jgi:hypothetical protein
MMETRFRSILSGACPAPLYDTVLWNLSDAVVTPTLGAIVPYWYLAIPRASVLSMAEGIAKSCASPLRYVNDVAERLRRRPEDILWFEHGASQSAAAIGCGVDHAHIHLLVDPPFSFTRMQEVVMSTAHLDWRQLSTNPYDAVSTQNSYFVMAKGRQSFVANKVDSAGSQFFRRAIASLIGKPDVWNYKTHPHLKNVELTIAAAQQAA